MLNKPPYPIISEAKLAAADPEIRKYVEQLQDWFAYEHKVLTTRATKMEHVAADAKAAAPKAAMPDPETIEGLLDREKFKAFRLKLGWTQQDMASFLGISLASASAWETGRSPIPHWAPRVIKLSAECHRQQELLPDEA
jgi:DNA-binding transcriptional regulator YiaG